LGSKGRKTSRTSWRLCSSTLGGMGRTRTRAWASATRGEPSYHAALRAHGTARLALSPSLYLMIQNGKGRGLVIREARVSHVPRGLSRLKPQLARCGAPGCARPLVRRILLRWGLLRLPHRLLGRQMPPPAVVRQNQRQALLGFLEDQSLETGLFRCIPVGGCPEEVEEVARFPAVFPTSAFACRWEVLK
jgi:hypothetical protein